MAISAYYRIGTDQLQQVERLFAARDAITAALDAECKNLAATHRLFTDQEAEAFGRLAAHHLPDRCVAVVKDYIAGNGEGALVKV